MTGLWSRVPGRAFGDGKMALISLISPKSLIFISQSVHKQTNICALWIGHLPTADWSVWWTLTNQQWVQCVHWLLSGNLSSWSCDICMQLWLQNCCSHSYRLCWQTHHGWWDSCSPAVPGGTFEHLVVLFGYLVVLLSTWWYFWMSGSTFGYLVVLLGTWWYFWVPGGTFEYLVLLLSTWWYFLVPDDTFGYLVDLWLPGGTFGYLVILMSTW